MLVVTGVRDRDGHETGSGHPERAERLDAVAAAVRDVFGDGSEEVVRVEPRPATLDELGRVHSLSYLRALDDLCAEGGGALDPDTVVSPGSCPTARLAAGAGLAAIAALEQGEGDAAFVAVRPPGHHALADRGMGFCLLNNIAVAAAALTQRGERVLIVDWDVHHGNGTQAIFWNDPSVLYVSTHQYPLFPGTGTASEIGGEAARGSTINFPLPEERAAKRSCSRSTRWSPRRRRRSIRPGCWSRPGSTRIVTTRSPACPSRRGTSRSSPAGSLT